MKLLTTLSLLFISSFANATAMPVHLTCTTQDGRALDSHPEGFSTERWMEQYPANSLLRFRDSSLGENHDRHLVVQNANYSQFAGVLHVTGVTIGFGIYYELFVNIHDLGRYNSELTFANNKGKITLSCGLR